MTTSIDWSTLGDDQLQQIYWLLATTDHEPVSSIELMQRLEAAPGSVRRMPLNETIAQINQIAATFGLGPFVTRVRHPSGLRHWCRTRFGDQALGDLIDHLSTTAVRRG